MNFLEVWDHPELFEDIDFSSLDKKIAFIQRNRRIYPIYDKVIQEINNRIDIDFIQDSELLELNTVVGLPEIKFDEDFEELFENNIFDKRVKNENIDDFFFGKYRTILQDGRLTIYRRDPVTKEINKFTCNMPKHLKALKETLAQAREDRIMKDLGIPVPLTTQFIEHVHGKLFKDFINDNRRYARNHIDILTPEGYGRFRRTLHLENGKEHKYNIVVEGLNWTPSDSDNVQADMQYLVDKYNESTFHPILKAAIFKTCLVNIQPFRDGNKRVSRIMFNYLLVRNGIPTVTINATERDKYLQALDTAITTNDYHDLVGIVTNELNYRCNQYLKLYNKLNLNEDCPSSKETVEESEPE